MPFVGSDKKRDPLKTPAWEAMFTRKKGNPGARVMQNLGVSNKEHYGMLWYFLEWSIALILNAVTNTVLDLFHSLRPLPILKFAIFLSQTQ